MCGGADFVHGRHADCLIAVGELRRAGKEGADRLGLAVAVDQAKRPGALSATPGLGTP